ncbi:hypothetical protein OG225_40650 (plasmid) [Nocardia sp. NBC_01377]
MADDVARHRAKLNDSAARDQILYQQNWAVVDDVVREFWTTARDMNLPTDPVTQPGPGMFAERGDGWVLPVGSARGGCVLTVRTDGSWTMDTLRGGGDMGPDLHHGNSEGSTIAWNSRIDSNELYNNFVSLIVELEPPPTPTQAPRPSSLDGDGEGISAGLGRRNPQLGPLDGDEEENTTGLRKRKLRWRSTSEDSW